MDVYHIRWIDSSSRQGWQKFSTLKPDVIETIGFVLEETDDYITITDSVADREALFECVDYMLTIPKFAITQIRIVSL